MALNTFYQSGAVSVDNGSAIVTGTGTLWGGDAIMPGDLFCDPAQPAIPPQRVKSVASDTELELWAAWPGTTLTDGAYEIRYVGIIERSTAQTRKVLEQLGEVDAYFDVQVDESADRAAYDDQPAGYRVLVSNTGDGRSAIYSKNSATSADWSDPAYVTGEKGDTGEQGPQGEKGDTGDISGLTSFWQTRVTNDSDAAAARAGLGLDALLNDKLDKDGTNAAARLKWRLRAIGEIVYVNTSLTGVEIPPADAGFIELTAGLDGAGEYNEGKLTSETITGSGATLVATAVIDDAGSPMDGQTINLINTEERVRYAGERSKAGDVFNDQMQQITGQIGNIGNTDGIWGHASVNSSGAIDATTIGSNPTPSAGSGARYYLTIDSANSPGARTGDRTRAKGQFMVAFLKYKDIA